MTHTPLTHPATTDLVIDFGVLVTDEIDRWVYDHDAGLDLRDDPGEVVIDFLLDPVNQHLVAAVLAGRGWQPPTRPCPRTATLKGPHGARCPLTHRD